MSGIAHKVEHVKAARASVAHGGHHCHWPGCGASVPPAMWGCSKHWYTLPAHLRSKIWQAFEPGQEISKTPSSAYLVVAREVQEWIAQYEARQPVTAKQQELF